MATGCRPGRGQAEARLPDYPLRDFRELNLRLTGKPIEHPDELVDRILLGACQPSFRGARLSCPKTERKAMACRLALALGDVLCAWRRNHRRTGLSIPVRRSNHWRIQSSANSEDARGARSFGGRGYRCSRNSQAGRPNNPQSRRIASGAPFSSSYLLDCRCAFFVHGSRRHCRRRLPWQLVSFEGSLAKMPAPNR